MRHQRSLVVCCLLIVLASPRVCVTVPVLVQAVAVLARGPDNLGNTLATQLQSSLHSHGQESCNASCAVAHRSMRDNRSALSVISSRMVAVIIDSPLLVKAHQVSGSALASNLARNYRERNVLTHSCIAYLSRSCSSMFTPPLC